jgi:hypothetical protein
MQKVIDTPVTPTHVIVYDDDHETIIPLRRDHHGWHATYDGVTYYVNATRTSLATSPAKARFA